MNRRRILQLLGLAPIAAAVPTNHTLPAAYARGISRVVRNAGGPLYGVVGKSRRTPFYDLMRVVDVDTGEALSMVTEADVVAGKIRTFRKGDDGRLICVERINPETRFVEREVVEFEEDREIKIEWIEEPPENWTEIMAAEEPRAIGRQGTA